MTLYDKLNILGSAAKYDVSCSSSGSYRKNGGRGIGNAMPSGICHSFTEDGRCVSLLKVLMTNHCIYDCAYCINRRSNDRRRATFTVKELVDITINFYRRNYIEGLFLSSGVLKDPDYTMERMVRIVKQLRLVHRYNGYIHLKSIPGAGRQWIEEAGLYADRLSVNIEIPTEKNLKILAPEKNFKGVLMPMSFIRNSILQSREERRKYRKALKFSSAGQSTQLIVGATPERDVTVLNLASLLYNKNKLKRVYYSGYMPVNEYDKRLPVLAEPPLVRENRLYQADWLLRFYHFSVNEIVNDKYPDLDPDVDPKLGYALRHPELFPVDINTADYERLLKVPGIGLKSAKLIISTRKFGKIRIENLKKMGVVIKRAAYFISSAELPYKAKGIAPNMLKKMILSDKVKKRRADAVQLQMF